MRKTLFVVHLAHEFEGNMRPGLLLEICAAIVTGGYDRVVFLDAPQGVATAYSFLHQCRPGAEHWEWSWGYCLSKHCEACVDGIIIPANGHAYTLVPDKIHGKSQVVFGEIHVCGGHRHECLRDWLDVLQWCGLTYQVLDHLTF